MEGVLTLDGVWADFGSGRGAFTLALADLLRVDAHIYSIDKNAADLTSQKRSFQSHFSNRPHPIVDYLHKDYTFPIGLPPLDGAVMANSLHFYKNKTPILKLIFDYLRPGGVIILVEYNVERGNPWVPHPISYRNWVSLAKKTGFVSTRLLETHHSSFLKEIYSSISHRPSME